jgi:hypothetical protein
MISSPPTPKTQALKLICFASIIALNPFVSPFSLAELF